LADQFSARKDFFWIAYGDQMRIYACIAVVILHSAAWVLFFQEKTVAETWSLNNLLSAACRWCVPVFIMLSGAIFLSRPLPESASAFLKKRVLRVGIPLLFWTAVYFAYSHFGKDIKFTLTGALHLFLLGRPYYHLYFLFVMIGLYLITPALKFFMPASPARPRADQIIVILILTSAVAMMNKYFAIKSANAFTFFIPFLGYYLAGAWLQEMKLKPKALALTWLVFIITVMLTMLEPRILPRIPGIRQPWAFDQLFVYCNPAVILMSICAFLILSNRPITTEPTGIGVSTRGRILRTVAQTTFGIYLIHPLILEISSTFYYLAFPGALPPALETPALALFTLLVSFSLILPMLKAPYLKSLIS